MHNLSRKNYSSSSCSRRPTAVFLLWAFFAPILLAVFPFRAVAATSTIESMAELKDAIGQMEAGASASFTFSEESLVSRSCITIPEGVHVTLGGNTEITLHSRSSHPLFAIEAGASLTLEGGVSLTGSPVSASAIVEVNGVSALFILQDGTLMSGGNGGGVAINAGRFRMEGGSIQQNSALLGGGVLVLPGAEFEMSGGSITGNTAEKGGGVYTEGIFTFTGGIIGGADYSANIAGDHFAVQGMGGGVFVAGGQFNMQGASDIAGNIAAGPDASRGLGGGLYVQAGNAEFSSGSIQGNTSCGSDTSVADGLGGGMYIAGSGAIVHLSGGDITGNSAKQGGGAYIGTEGRMNAFAGSISGNTSGIAGAVQGMGGGVHVGGGALALSLDIVISDNAAFGTDNAAGCGLGGGVYVSAGSASMLGGSIRANAAHGNATNNAGRGGGVYNACRTGDTAGFSITDGSVAANRAELGAGIYNEAFAGGAALALVAGGRISGNMAGAQGGGVYNSAAGGAAHLHITGGTLSANTATKAGGGVYSIGASGGSAVVLMTGGAISENAAPQGDGVAMHSEAGAGLVSLQLQGKPLIGATIYDNAIYAAAATGIEVLGALLPSALVHIDAAEGLVATESAAVARFGGYVPTAQDAAAFRDIGVEMRVGAPGTGADAGRVVWQAPTLYTFTQIAGAWTGSSSATIKTDGEAADFLYLMVGQTMVSFPGDASYASGSTIFTLSEAFLKKLPGNTYPVMAAYKGGYAISQLTLGPATALGGIPGGVPSVGGASGGVANVGGASGEAKNIVAAPQTGDFSDDLVWVLVGVTAMIGLVVCWNGRAKKRNSGS